MMDDENNIKEKKDDSIDTLKLMEEWKTENVKVKRDKKSFKHRK